MIKQNLIWWKTNLFIYSYYNVSYEIWRDEIQTKLNIVFLYLSHDYYKEYYIWNMERHENQIDVQPANRTDE